MLTSLSIKNFALIDDIGVDFGVGFTVITGETGAGKSILLDALSLVLGQRADLQSLKNKEQKCVVEAIFNVQQYQLQEFFRAHDLDYEDETFLRREILPSGKSRAFINDSPVTLSVLDALGKRLIDIHSQHQTLDLAKNDFQFQILDALANNHEALKAYRSVYFAYQQAVQRVSELETLQASASKELDYHSFLLNELGDAQLHTINQEALEAEQDTLSNVEDIQAQLGMTYQLLDDEQLGVLQATQQLKNHLQQIATFSEGFAKIYERVESVSIELDDIYSEIQLAQERVEADPARLQTVNELLEQLYNLQKKHQVSTVEALQRIEEELVEKVDQATNVEEAIANATKERDLLLEELSEKAAALSQGRKKAIPQLKEQLETMLAELSMENARFEIQLEKATTFLAQGNDTIQFLLSANKGGSFGPLKKVASGGELSRIMLCVKAILSRYIKLPAIVFDEIDTGVSGTISDKVASIMLQMSNRMQVFAITHLPQVAAKGQQHFKVYKTDDEVSTSSHLKQLNSDERIVEIAQMLGGSQLTESAVAHAKQLLN